MHEESGDIIDPHTADGVKVTRENVEDGIPMLVLETAEPEKFSETILEAIGMVAGVLSRAAGTAGSVPDRDRDGRRRAGAARTDRGELTELTHDCRTIRTATA